MEEIPIGSRKLQNATGAFVLNVPAAAAAALDLKTGDMMRWSIRFDGSLRVAKEDEKAAVSADPARQPLNRDRQQTPEGVVTSDFAH